MEWQTDEELMTLIQEELFTAVIIELAQGMLAGEAFKKYGIL